MIAKRRLRHVTPSIVSRWLEVKPDTVIGWIRSRDLPAINIGTHGGRPTYLIFRKDLAEFLDRRGMTATRIRELLGGE